jgi:hypothetical protein
MHGRTGLLRSQTKSGGWRKWKTILEMQKAEVRAFYAKKNQTAGNPAQFDRVSNSG